MRKATRHRALRPSHIQARAATSAPLRRRAGTRPKTFDRAAYQHNFQAARSYKIGPYQRPSGWVNRRWGFGDRLPHAYWASQYLLADYWLFGLEVPPVDYEWVRVGVDALLISTSTGEVLQAEYGVFG
jgi:Ni/Co efflux regulator RcnB